MEWEAIDRLPCTVRLLKTSVGSIDFYDFAEYEQLVTATARLDARVNLIVLLAEMLGFGQVKCEQERGAT